ncbi:MAG: glycosyltransferase family 2 protein [Cyclobacteriaceae bacterium]
MFKISIITVCYNAENIILPTLKSVLKQGFDQYEHIIVDGDSNDRTKEIISSYASHPKITVISEKDTGVYDAMNKGLVLAKGEYVLFLNAGDELAHENTLNQIFAYAANSDLIYGETNILDKDRKYLGTRSQLTSRKLPQNLCKKDFLNGQVVSHQSFIPKRVLCKPYELKYRCSADINWMLEIIDRCKTIHKTNEPISNYLQGGISDTQLVRCWKERFFILLNHFNPVLVLWRHLLFVLRYVRYGAYRN